MSQKLDTGASVNAQQNQQKKRLSTKAKAILAGGLVLGVGTAITLAAWTDTEWATGLFQSGSFDIEGSTDGTTWDDHPTTGAPATLSFSIGADVLAPDDTVYAPFAVRLKAGTTNEAAVTVSQDDSSKLTGTTASYKYTTSAVCDETAYNAGTNENGTSFDLEAVTTPVYLCFKVSADSNLPQGQSGSFTWTFNATSGDAL